MRIQKNISLRCPYCSEFDLMPIIRKDKKGSDGKILYTVKCRRCCTCFQSEKPPNFWRTLHKDTNLSKADIRRLQQETLETVMRGEIPQINDMGSMIFVDGKLVPKRQK